MEDDLYKIDVSGKIYKINREILMKIPYFCNMINDTKINEKYIFVQRSPKIFDDVLSYVIDVNYPFPKKYYSELDFYGIEYNKLFDSNTEIMKELIIIKDDLSNKNTLLVKELTDIKEEIEFLKNANIINNVMISVILHSVSIPKCCFPNCKNETQNNKLSCKDHIKLCIIKECKKEAIKYNFCDFHLKSRKKFQNCIFKSCRYSKIQNKDYCFMHINEK